MDTPVHLYKWVKLFHVHLSTNKHLAKNISKTDLLTYMDGITLWTHLHSYKIGYNYFIDSSEYDYIRLYYGHLCTLNHLGDIIL